MPHLSERFIRELLAQYGWEITRLRSSKHYLVNARRGSQTGRFVLPRTPNPDSRWLRNIKADLKRGYHAGPPNRRGKKR